MQSDVAGGISLVSMGHSSVGTTEKIYKHRLDIISKKTVSIMSKALQR